MTAPADLIRSRNWLRAELLSVAAVHALMGAVIAWAPRDIVVTSGSAPVFELMPRALDIDEARAAYAVLFTVTGLAISVLAWSATRLVVHVVAFLSVWSTGLWSLTFLIAALNGLGSALGAVVFPAILLWVGFLLIRVTQSSGAQCGSS